MAADVLVENQGNTRLVSLPPTISAGCGLSLLVEDSSVEEILKILKKEKIPYSNVYEKIGMQEYKKYGGEN